MNHTPAPWDLRCESVDREWQILTNVSGMRIIANLHISNDTELANAYLIKAAPNLLDALIYLRGCIETGREPAMGSVNEAISRATGSTV